MIRVSILLIAVVFLTTAALIAGMVGCGGYAPSPSQDLEIRTWYDLNAIRDNLSGNHTLMNDLNSTTAGYEELASPTANGGRGWLPIGSLEPVAFSGTFHGQGYEVRDLYINHLDRGSVGLFGTVSEGARIQDIGVVSATAYGLTHVGGLAGFNRGTISNCYATGNVSGKWEVGGLVGENYGTVGNSYSSVDVTGFSDVGGLVGLQGSIVSHCHATRNVYGHTFVGGLVGQNSGTVTDSYSSGNVTGKERVGGLVGLMHAGAVSDCYSTGEVTGTSEVGGLVGASGGTTSNSFWDTETSGQTTSDGGEGKTSAEMKSIATFAGADWNIIAVADPSIHNSSYIWNIVDNVTYPLLSQFLCCPQEPLTQMTTMTVPLGYFELTVSPAEVRANVGEQIEIRCTIDVRVNCIIDINSVYVVLFDSYDSIVRQQAMTKDYSWYSTNTVYAIVGDEAHYMIKISFTISGDGKHSEYGAHSFPIVVNHE